MYKLFLIFVEQLNIVQSFLVASEIAINHEKLIGNQILREFIKRRPNQGRVEWGFYQEQHVRILDM